MIIFELDGTLADCNHRRHFFEPYPQTPLSGVCKKRTNWKSNWEAFYEACDKDTPIIPVIEIFRNQVNLFKSFDEKINWEIWSGRSEAVRDKTLEWIKKHVYVKFDDSRLKMRPVGDQTPDHELKRKWLEEALAEGKQVDYVFEDRPKVVDMYRKHGIFVFDCNQAGGSLND